MASIDILDIYNRNKAHFRAAFALHCCYKAVDKADFNLPITYTLRGNNLDGNNLHLTFRQGGTAFGPSRIYHVIDIEYKTSQAAEYRQRGFLFAAYDSVKDTWLLGVRILYMPKGRPEEVFMRVFGRFGHRKQGFYMIDAPYALDTVKVDETKDVDSKGNIRHRHDKVAGKKSYNGLLKK